VIPVHPKEVSMNTIAAASHHSLAGGTVRAGAAPSQAQADPRGLATLLLAAVVAALAVVADQLIDSWADGHVLLMWVMLWAVVFAATLVFAGTARRVAQRLAITLNGWSRAAAQRRAEARMWEMAQADPRLMSELVAASQRADVEEATSPEQAIAQATIPSSGEALSLAQSQAPYRRLMSYV
jgi:hypothetical protein